MMIGKPIVKVLLFHLINCESYNTHSIEKNRIIKILESCEDDYITIGEILTNDNIKLNCFFLKHYEYSIFGFANLYNKDTGSLPEENYEQWIEILSNQLVNIFFTQFNSLNYKNKFANRVFFLLNYLSKNYVQQYDNIVCYKANYTFKLLLEKLSVFEISISLYERENILGFIIKDLINKQLIEFQKVQGFDRQNYFLLSYYLKESEQKSKLSNINYKEDIEKITNYLLDNLKKYFSEIKEKKEILLDFEFFENIDFALLYKLSSNKENWINIFNLNLYKSALNSDDIFIPNRLSLSYLKILILIFKETKDRKIAEIIGDIVIELGLKSKYSIFDFEKDSNIFIDYIGVLNLFDESDFEKFLEALVFNNKLKMLLQLLTYSISETRKEKITKKIEEVFKKIDEENISYFDIRESIMYTVNNSFLKLATNLINIYRSKMKKVNLNTSHYNSFKKGFDEIIYKKELIDILENKKINTESKFEQLNNYRTKIDDKYLGNQSIALKCDTFKELIRAFIFFYDKQYEKSYKLLDQLCQKELNSINLINMVNSYFKAYEEDKNKIEKYNYILNKYEKYQNKFEPYVKTIHEYQVLLHGYTVINEPKMVISLLEKMPKEYEYDFDIFRYKYHFLINNEQDIKAKEYILEFKKFYKDNERVLKNIDKLESDLDSNLRMKIEDTLDVKLNFETTKLSMAEAQKYWHKIKDMSLHEHAQIFYNGSTKEEYIFQIISQISIELLKRKECLLYEKEEKDTLELEDKINDWICSLLNHRMNFLSWNIKDQTRGGISASKRGVGERDLIVYDKYDNRIFLFEAFRLFSCNKSYIKNHMDKLDGYNAEGANCMIVMVYVWNNDFTKLCQNYELFLKTFEYANFDKLSLLKEHEFQKISNDNPNIQILKETRKKNEKDIIIYHYLLDFK